MNAAPRSVQPQRRRSGQPIPHSRGTRSRTIVSSTVTSIPSRTTGSKVEKLNAPQQATPVWLSSLLFMQRSSDIVTFLLVASTLIVYSWTVYTQQQWAQEYRKLENLQRNERHLTTANEVMKDQLAQQAENPATGLVNPNQDSTIFLPSAPQRQVYTTSTQTSDRESASTPPLGY